MQVKAPEQEWGREPAQPPKPRNAPRVVGDVPRDQGYSRREQAGAQAKATELLEQVQGRKPEEGKTEAGEVLKRAEEKEAEQAKAKVRGSRKVK